MLRRSYVFTAYQEHPLPHFESSLFDLTFLKHGFFTRQGGVSQGPFESLNVSYKSDSPECVDANRTKIAKSLGFQFDHLVVLRQIHSGIVRTVDSPLTNIIEGDAIVTKTPGLLIGIQTADCVPVLLCDPDSHVIAVVHAGWRGALIEDVIPETIRAMEALGAKRSTIRAALGPCIWQDSYEVSWNVFKALKDKSFLKQGGDRHHFYFNLPGYIEHQLNAEGSRVVASSPADTFGDAKRFFSCRRSALNKEELFGCHLSVIGWQSE